MALNEQESQLLAELLGKAEWPLPKAVFHALLGMSISVPLELCVLNEQQDHILLFERKDHEFDAILGPGTVLRDSDDSTLIYPIKRLLEGELKDYDLTYPENIGWIHVDRGTASWENPTRHEISLVFISRLVVGGRREGKGVLYPLNALPKRLIGYHVAMINQVAQYLQNGKPILG